SPKPWGRPWPSSMTGGSFTAASWRTLRPMRRYSAVFSACHWKRIEDKMTQTTVSLPNRVAAGIERFGGVMLLPVALAIIALVLIGQPTTWATLTIAGLAMGMMIFL